MEIKVLEGDQINSELDFHYLISKLLDFQIYFGLDFDTFWNSFYGKNFNAFWDCFTDCLGSNSNFKIVIKDSNHAKESMKDDFLVLIECFDDAKKKFPKFDYSLE